MGNVILPHSSGVWTTSLVIARQLRHTEEHETTFLLAGHTTSLASTLCITSTRSSDGKFAHRPCSQSSSSSRCRWSVFGHGHSNAPPPLPLLEEPLNPSLISFSSLTMLLNDMIHSFFQSQQSKKRVWLSHRMRSKWGIFRTKSVRGDTPKRGFSFFSFFNLLLLPKVEDPSPVKAMDSLDLRADLSNGLFSPKKKKKEENFPQNWQFFFKLRLLKERESIWYQIFSTFPTLLTESNKIKNEIKTDLIYKHTHTKKKRDLEEYPRRKSIERSRIQDQNLIFFNKMRGIGDNSSQKKISPFAAK